MAAGDDAKRLFDDARRGDQRPLDELCRAMRPALFRAAFALLLDRDEADDVAQEALVRALTRRFTFLAKGPVAGWMTRIAINLAKNRLRDRARRRRLLEGAPARALEESAGQGPPPPDRGVLVDERVERALSSLSSRQREVVRLRLFGELSFAEIGAALSITEENARVTFSQARARLKARMEGGLT